MIVPVEIFAREAIAVSLILNTLLRKLNFSWKKFLFIIQVEVLCLDFVVLTFFFCTACEDKVPNNYNPKNKCPSYYCPYLASNGHCEKTWNSIVGGTCRKKISNRWARVKALCKKSCNNCGKIELVQFVI